MIVESLTEVLFGCEGQWTIAADDAYYTTIPNAYGKVDDASKLAVMVVKVALQAMLEMTEEG